MKILAAIICAFMLLAAPRAVAQSPTSQPSDPSFLQPEDQSGLPRVLLIGDSISIGYTLPVRELLRGKANVHRIPVLATTTRQTLDQFETWIGREQWDVIHFNWGLHDLRRMPDGSTQTSLHEYEQNLRQLIQRLRPLTKKLIWCSTTPVPGAEVDPPRYNTDVVAFNAVARRVMIESRIPINDLYAFVVPQADRIRKPLNVHFTSRGSIVLAQQVARCIRQVMDLETEGASRSCALKIDAGLTSIDREAFAPPQSLNSPGSLVTE